MIALAALFLLPAILHTPEPSMPFYDVVRHERGFAVPVNAASLEDVNNYWNHHLEYVKPTNNHWQTPEESLKRGTGSCRDFAVAKYYTLKQQGYDVRRMKITVVIWKDWVHAVLVVDGKILDNMTDEIKDVSEVNDMFPLYSINEKSFWMAK